MFEFIGAVLIAVVAFVIAVSAPCDTTRLPHSRSQALREIMRRNHEAL